MKIRTLMPSLKGATKIINKKSLKAQSDVPTLVYFWAMSCSQCEQSFEKLEVIGDIFKEKLNIHAIHMPREKLDYSYEPIKEKIRQLGITYPVHLDNELTISDRYGNKIVPAYYLFDHQQQLRFYHAGSIPTISLQKRIERII